MGFHTGHPTSTIFFFKGFAQNIIALIAFQCIDYIEIKLKLGNFNLVKLPIFTNTTTNKLTIFQKGEAYNNCYN